MKNRLSIIIVNYNGRDLLEEGMPTILDAATFSNLIYEIIVVDNASVDDSVDFLKREYPIVTILQMRSNNFWFSINEGIVKSSYDYALLLNNDIKLGRHCIDYLFAHFNKGDETIFAVTPKEMDWDGLVPLRGAQGIEVKNEALCQSARSYYFDKAHITFKADNSMYAKDKLMGLGLFDPIFLPFYYEDTDISYRAWKTGFKIIYEPRAIIYHKSGSSINRYITEDRRRIYNLKNSFLFVWKDVTDPYLFLNHILFLTLRLIKGLLFFRSKKDVVVSFILAMRSLRQLRISRRKAKAGFVLTDSEVLDKLSIRRFDEDIQRLFNKSTTAKEPRR